MKKLIIVYISLILFGCTSADSVENTNLVSKVNSAEQSLFPYGNPNNSNSELISDYDWYNIQDEKEREQKRNEGIKFFKEAISLAYPITQKIDPKNSISAQNFIKETNNYFLENKNERALYISKQIIATRLQSYIFPDLSIEQLKTKSSSDIQLSNDKIQLLHYASKLLVHNGNPNADLIAYNLSLLEKNIDKDSLVSYAGLSIANAERWEKNQDEYYTFMLKKNTHCTDCEEQISQLLEEINSQEKRIMIKDAKETLKQYLKK